MTRTLAACVLALLPACNSTTPGSETAAPPAPEPIALFNGVNLDGWYTDIPRADENPEAPASFVVRDGLLVSDRAVPEESHRSALPAEKL